MACHKPLGADDSLALLYFLLYVPDHHILLHGQHGGGGISHSPRWCAVLRIAEIGGIPTVQRGCSPRGVEAASVFLQSAYLTFQSKYSKAMMSQRHVT